MITSAEQAESILVTGQADLIGLARTITYDSHWPWHAAERLGATVKAPSQYLRSEPDGREARCCGLDLERQMNGPGAPRLMDGFGRAISYLRLSVTDRCNLRCRYCMAEEMQFLSRSNLLSIEELAIISERLVARGIERIRLTGGEPLTRQGFGELARRLGLLLKSGGLKELTLTTNGTRLADHSAMLAEAGIKRINVSLDSRDAGVFRQVTRRGDLSLVLAGIAAARSAGLQVKINMVALRGVNDREIPTMLRWCVEEGYDLTLIETMPLGRVDDDRYGRYLALDAVLQGLQREFRLSASKHQTGGPARYFDVDGGATRLGLITPMSCNFCSGCNRIRLTAEGRLFTCLGHDDHVDLRSALRAGGADALDVSLDAALRSKPLRHDFVISPGSRPAVERHMSATGG